MLFTRNLTTPIGFKPPKGWRLAQRSEYFGQRKTVVTLKGKNYVLKNALKKGILPADYFGKV